MPLPAKANPFPASGQGPRDTREPDGGQGFAGLVQDTARPADRGAEGARSGRPDGDRRGESAAQSGKPASPDDSERHAARSGDGTEADGRNAAGKTSESQNAGAGNADGKTSESPNAAAGNAEGKTAESRNAGANGAEAAKARSGTDAENAAKTRPGAASDARTAAKAAKSGPGAGATAETLLAQARAAAKQAAPGQANAEAADGKSPHGQRVRVSVHHETPVARPGGPLNGATAVAAADAAQQAQDKTSDAAAKAAARFVGSAEAEAAAEQAGAAKRGRRSADASDLRGRAAENAAKGERADADGKLRGDGAKAQTRNAVDPPLQTARSPETAAARAETSGQAPTTAQPTAGTAGSTQAQSFDPVMQPASANASGTPPSGLEAGGKTLANAQSARPTPVQPAVDQVAVQIQRAAANGQKNVQIRLNPAELGRIDVKLEMREDGAVRAVLAVDKPETLDLMQRDPRALEKALQDAGLKTDGGSLSFNLRGEGEDGGQGGGQDPDAAPAAGLAGDTADDEADAAVDAARRRAGAGRLDIRV